MEQSDKTARQILAEVKANPNRARLGFGSKAVQVNVDLQKAHTDTSQFATANERDPDQITHINALARRFRTLQWPVVWTRVSSLESGEDAGVWGNRTNSADSLQKIFYDSARAQFDDRCDISEHDVIYTKWIPPPFFETLLQSLLVWHQVDTVILTGGSTSGCIREVAVDSLSRGHRTILPEQCVADKHESYHFANLMDLMLKYAHVLDLSGVFQWLDARIAGTA